MYLPLGSLWRRRKDQLAFPCAGSHTWLQALALPRRLFRSRCWQRWPTLRSIATLTRLSLPAPAAPQPWSIAMPRMTPLRNEVFQLALSRETGRMLSTQALALGGDGGAGSSVAIAEATARVAAATTVTARTENERVNIKTSCVNWVGRDRSGLFE